MKNNPKVRKSILKDLHIVESYQVLTVDLCRQWKIKTKFTESKLRGKKRVIFEIMTSNNANQNKIIQRL